MKKEEELKLLARDIFGRALCGLKVNYHGDVYTLGYNFYLNEISIAFESYPMKCFLEKITDIKPYLRPMSSMTQEEQREFDDFCVIDEEAWKGTGVNGFINQAAIMSKGINWLNVHHFDYYGWIEKGRALKASDDMYKFNEQTL